MYFKIFMESSKTLMQPLRKVTKTFHKYVAMFVLYSIKCNILLIVTLSLALASHALKGQYSNS